MTEQKLRNLLIMLVAIFLAVPVFGSMEQGSVFGIWLTEGGDAKLEIFPCGDKACAKVHLDEAPNLRKQQGWPGWDEKGGSAEPGPETIGADHDRPEQRVKEQFTLTATSSQDIGFI